MSIEFKEYKGYSPKFLGRLKKQFSLSEEDKVKEDLKEDLKEDNVKEDIKKIK